MTHEDIPYMKHILDSIRDAGNFTKGLSKEAFLKDKLKQSAVVRQLEIIGEAVKNISKRLKEKYPEVEWAKMAGTRDIMIHAYFKVDLDIVWDIVKRDLPKLEENMKRILKESGKK